MQMKGLSDCMSVHAAVVSIVAGGEELALVLLCSAPLPSHAAHATVHQHWKEEDCGAVVKVGSSLPVLCLKTSTVSKQTF